MSLMSKLRELLETEDEVDEVDEVEGDGVDGVDEVEGDGDGVDEVEGDGDGVDEVEGDGVDEVEGTPADNDESPEVAELRQQLSDQAALIETLRNQIAALGGDPIEDGVEIDKTQADESDVVADFNNDYAEREALLAEMKGN